ncbi:MAG TPA: ArsI/CadI family heavy metal resistance metalloenzyme [Pyrinomonadaceae bacterium]|jgi:catechol 2,3-dioxygenase-like lactoylglutathione lyase family enzyme
MSQETSELSRETTPQVVALKAHLALNVRDVERSTEFYRKMLGLEPSKVRKGYAKFDVQNPPLNLTLNEAGVRERGALSHLGIQVAATSDVLAMREQWRKLGLDTRDEMQTNCCYALQDKAWVCDPDGNEWEVFVVIEDNLSETTMCCASLPDAQEQEAALALSSTTGSAAPSACSEPTAASQAAGQAASHTQSSCCSTGSGSEPVGISR